MSRVGRRSCIKSIGFFAVAGTLPSSAGERQLQSPAGSGRMKLDLSDFQPKSMLHVPESRVLRSRYPVIDIHTHLSIRAHSVNGVGIGEEMEFLAAPETILPVMDRKNVRLMVNLTGGSGKGLQEAV